jgi:hypothetical protein
MEELRIDSRRQGLFEAFDSFRNLAEPFHVAAGISAALFVADDSKALAECSGEVG